MRTTTKRHLSLFIYWIFFNIKRIKNKSFSKVVFESADTRVANTEVCLIQSERLLKLVLKLLKMCHHHKRYHHYRHDRGYLNHHHHQNYH